MAEEVYEVEKIVSHKVFKKGKKHDIFYLIKWSGYGEADNTWEKEANVFAVDMVANYWKKVPRNDPDRRLFEKIQSTKKNPIIIPDTNNKRSTDKPSIPRTIASMSSTSSLSASPEPKKQQQKLNDFFSDSEPTTTSRKGKEREDGPVKPMDYEMETSKRLPVVVANETDELDEDDEVDELEKPTKKNGTNGSTIHEDGASPSFSSSSSDDVQVIDVPPAKMKALKRKKPTYSDYFLEEHERKKRMEGGYESTDSEVISIGSMKVPESDDAVIFDDNYGTDPPKDWDNLAEKVVYIGHELPESPLYCIIQWKDGVKSVHPLSLVRDKRPDLVIDCFVTMVGG